MTQAPKRISEDRKKLQCLVCESKYRSDHLVRHMLLHKEHILDDINLHCRIAAIERRQPMLFYLPDFVNKRNGYVYDAKKRFCICLICEKGKYAGCRGDTPEEFYRKHSTSDCMKQWETVANLFGTVPVVEAKPDEIAQMDFSNLDTIDLSQLDLGPTITRRLERYKEIVKSLEDEATERSKRYNEIYTENKRLVDENLKLQRQLLEIQAAKASPPAAYDFDAPAPGVPLPPPVVAVKPSPAEPAPTLTTVPAEPAPAPTVEDAPPPEDSPAPLPNANRPGYFLAKSGKWLKRASTTPASEPAPAPAYNLPNPIVRNPGAVKLPGMAQLAASAPPKPAPMPKLFDPSSFLTSLMKEIDAPPSAAEVAAERAHDVKELVEVTIFDLLENIVVRHWTAERVGAYIDKVQAENKDIKMFDVIMEKKCGAILQYVDGDESEDCLDAIETLYEARR